MENKIMMMMSDAAHSSKGCWRCFGVVCVGSAAAATQQGQHFERHFLNPDVILWSPVKPTATPIVARNLDTDVRCPARSHSDVH